MHFIKRKSVAGSPEEPARRNRLTKSPANRTPYDSSLSTTRQQQESPITINSIPQTPFDLQKTDSRSQLRSHLFELQDKNGSVIKRKPVGGGLAGGGGIAHLIQRFEHKPPTTSPSQSSLSSWKTRPMSEVTTNHQQYTPLQKMLSNESHMNRLEYRKSSSPIKESPIDSLDSLTDAPDGPGCRKSSFVPGQATRKPSTTKPVSDHTVTPSVLLTPSKGDKTQAVHRVSVMSNTTDEWTLPPRVERTETPKSLANYNSLGNLSLGSLHVVNGTTSPTVTDLSQQLRTMSTRVGTRRLVSSNYGSETAETVASTANEDWEDDRHFDDDYDTVTTPPPRPTTQEGRRDFSYETGDEMRLAAATDRATNQQHMTNIPSTPLAQVKTTDIAQEYISELAASPFSNEDGSETGSVIHHDDAPEEAIDATRNGDLNEFSQPRTASLESKLSSVQSGFTREEGFSSALEFQPSRSPEHVHRGSASKPVVHSDSGYGSNVSLPTYAVEQTSVETHRLPQQENFVYNAEQSNPNKAEKAASQAKPLKEKSGRGRLGGFLPRRPVLARSAVTAPVVPMVETATPSPKHHKASTIRPELHKTATAPQPTKEPKSPKKLQKIRPLSQPPPPKELVVQRVVSIDGLNIPPISPVHQANLKLRSEAIPELQRTYYTSQDVKAQASKSTLLSLPVADIRFPSPTPELEDGEEEDRGRRRSKSRSRSKSRRRSFLEFFKRDKTPDKRDSGMNQLESQAKISDFGDIISALGTDPYDIAYSTPPPTDNVDDNYSNARPGLNPHQLSVRKPRPRSMMDDQTASDFARARSRSIHERDKWHEKRTSFEGRNGVPGRNVRVSSATDDAPPLPPMPTKEQLRRISWRPGQRMEGMDRDQDSRQSSHKESARQSMRTDTNFDRTPERDSRHAPLSHTNTPQKLPHSNNGTSTESPQGYWEQSSPQGFDSSPAPPPPSHSPRPRCADDSFYDGRNRDLPPPPPSHSPRPMDVSDDYYHEQEEGQWREDDLPPPPPSHSPRPMDVEPELDTESEPVDAWAAQAAAWKARRQSAGEALRFRNSMDAHGQRPAWHEHEPVFHDQPAYPVIPPRRGREPQRPQQHGPYYHGQHQPPRSHTWDDGQNHGAHLYERTVPQHRNSYHEEQLHHFYADDHYSYQPIPYQPLSQPDVPARSPRRPLPAQSNHITGYPQPPRQQSRPRQQPQPVTQNHNHNQNQYEQEQYHHNPRPTSRLSAVSAVSVRSGHSAHSRHSAISARSYASSLAEELHPPDLQRTQPAPDYGRYTGGMGYSYEGREKGFGGSAGTRSASGKADAQVKGIELRQDWGVDLGDVPVIGLMKRI